MAPVRGSLLLPVGLVLLCASGASPGPPAGEGKGAARQGAARADRYGDPLPEGALARFGTVRLRHAAPVLCVAFSADGKLLASGSSDRTVRLWDVATGKPVRHLDGELGDAAQVLFSPDGNTLFVDARTFPGPLGMGTARADLVRALDLATGKEVRRFQGPGSFVTSLALTRDGKTLGATSDSGHLVLWDTATGRERLRRGPNPVDGAAAPHLALSPDGKTLATSRGRNGLIRLYDVASGKQLKSLVNSDPVSCLAFSPDGRTLAVNDAGKAIVLWDVGRGKRAHRTGEHAGHAHALAFAPDGKVLACASGPAVFLWDPATGKELARLEGHLGAVRCLAFSPDGKLLASGGGDRTVRLWDLGTRRPLHAYSGEPAGDVGVAVVAGGTRLALRHALTTESWGPGGSTSYKYLHALRLWSDFRRQGKAHGAAGPLVGHGSLVVSLDGRVCAVPGEKGLVRLLDTASGKELRAFGKRGGMRRASPVAFSPDGKLLAVESNEPPWHRHPVELRWSVRVWDVAAGTEVCTLKGHFGFTPPVVRFSPCGRVLATAESGLEPPTVSLWSAASGKQLPSPEGDSLRGSWFAFTPDGRYLIAGGDVLGIWGGVKKDEPRDLGVQVRELLTGRTAVVLKDLRGANCNAVSPCGKFLALGFEDGRVRLYDLDTGKLLRRLEGHRGAVTALAFTPDGKALVSGSADSTALVWDVAAVAPPAGKPLAAAELAKLWADLAGSDAGVAHRALSRLSRAPQQAVPFLKARLRPIPAGAPERLRQLLADLDSRVYATRARAMGELRSLELAAVPALRDALKGALPLEARRRVGQLLAAAHDPASSPAQLRALRALACLERPGTAAARALLRELAGGAPEARLTQEARACLRRLALR
jgi:WD40 repeat protein